VTAPAIPGRLRRYPSAGTPADPGVAGGQAGRPGAWSAASGRWFLLVWLLVLVVLLANDPGRMIFDTKLGVDINAAGFFGRLWSLWNPLEWFGTLQDQYIGYGVPMAPFFLVGQFLRLPIWIIERLWLSLLIAAGFWGVTKLATALRIGSDGSRLLAGTVFALWPTFTIIIGSTSAGAVPGLLAPWAVLPLVTALRGPRRSVAAACARSGIAILLMGGVNAVVTIWALLLPALYIVTHTRGMWRVRVLVSWAVAVVAATAWWAVPLLLQGHYSFNFLPYVEQSATTTKTMSTDAFLRGAGNWTAYFNLGSPWLSAGWAMASNPGAIIASAVAAAAGLCGLARRDMPERRWLRLSIGIAALVALAGYSGPFGGPLHGLVQSLLNGPLAPFRNVSKLEPVVALALALGIAHLLGRTSGRVMPTPRGYRNVAASIALAPVIVLCLVGLALPYLTNQVLQPRSFTQMPGYWSAVAGYLARHAKNETALIVPGDSHGIYLWGDPIDDPLEPLASSPWVERSQVPFGGAGSQVFLDTAENAIESGQQVTGLAAYLARADIRYVVVRNDLSTSDLGYTPPNIVHQTLALSGFTRVASFGPLITGKQTNPGAIAQVQAYLPKYPAVEVYQANSATDRPSSPVAALPVSSAALVDGGPDSMLQLAGQGILGNQATIIAGDPTAGSPALWAVTDGQRRQDTAFGLINSNTSYTYTANETNPVDESLGGGGGPPRQLLPVPADGHQTVAVLSGAASVTASSYGSWLSYQPQYDPVNAFDGNSNTAWAEGSATTPDGQWIQITFDRPLDLPGSIGVQLLDDQFSRAIANQVRVSTAQGQVTTPTVPTNATQQLRVRPGLTRWLRITITGASNVVAGNPGAGIREVLIPGVRVTRYLEPPQDASVRSAASVAFSFRQPAPTPAGQVNLAATEPIARLFSLPVPLRLQLTAAAVAQPSTSLYSLIGRLAPPSRSSLIVSASSTWGSLPTFGPDNMFGNGLTPWISGTSDPVITLSWHGLRRISQIVVQAPFGFAAAPPKIKVSSFFGDREATIGLGGVATIWPPLVTNQLNLSFPGWSSAAQPGTSGQPVLGLARLRVPALAGLHVATVDQAAPFSLPCGRGPLITLDGQSYKTSVSGTLGELAGTLPVSLRLCTPQSAVDLGSGQHRLLIEPGRFTVTDVALQTPAPAGAPAPAPARAVHVLGWQPESRTVRIGPGQATYLEVHENANSGWQATLNGVRLTAARLDGWQQAFIVPAGAGGVISMTFAPATWYHVSLALSALAIVGLFVVATRWRRWMSYVLPVTYFVCLEAGTTVLLRGTRIAAVWGPIEVLALLAIAVGGLAIVRFRRSSARVQRWAQARERARQRVARQFYPAGTRQQAGRGSALDRRIRRWAGPVAVGLLILLVGGPVVLAVPLIAIVAALRPRWLPVISLAAMIVAGLIAASAGVSGAANSGAFGPGAQACALVALAAALYPQATASRAASRAGWRPSRPLPAPGARGPLPASVRREPLGVGRGGAR
jgi:arabinofuranan 3-O-arabinosyltransferase